MTQGLLDLDRFLPYRLSFTANLVSDFIAGAYEGGFEITIPEWRVISWVAQCGEVTQNDICLRTRMDKVSVSRAAIALTQRGYLERRPNRSDRRSHLLTLTPSGVDLYTRIAPRALELEGKIFSKFSDEQVAVFVAMLREIDRTVSDLTGDDLPPSG